MQEKNKLSLDTEQLQKKKIDKRRRKTITEAILVKWGHPQVVRFIFEGSSQSEQKVDRLKVFKSYI